MNSLNRDSSPCHDSGEYELDEEVGKGVRRNGRLVSIVINNYNYAEYLRAAIDSALNQTYSNCEVIVVDDGSTDDSRLILEEYGARIIKFEKKNGGQASAFNLGIEKARGEYILLLDSDDVLKPNAIKVCVESINLRDTVRLTFGLDIIDEKGKQTGHLKSAPRVSFQGTLLDYIMQNNRFLGTPTSGNFFRARELKQCLDIPEMRYKISADLYLFFRIAELGDMQCLTESLGHYRIHGNNNYTQAGSRIFLNKKQLHNNCRNICQAIQLMNDYIACASENRVRPPKLGENIFVNINNLEVLSDGLREGFENNESFEVSHSWLVKTSFKMMFLKKGGDLHRGAIGFLSVCCNAFSPPWLAARVINKIYKIKLK